MSEIIKVLPEEPRQALEALALFRFLTVKQFVRLGIGASDTVVRDYVLNRLEKRARPLTKSKKLSRWLPKVHYMTHHGAAELAEMYKLPIEEIRYPKGQVQFSEMLAKHRFAQIDFHIGLQLWAHSRGDTEIAFSEMDFDVQGSRLHGTFKNPTAIDLPNSDKPVVADGIFGIVINDTPLLYALEVHRTTQTKAVGIQIQRYMDVLQSGAMSFKYGSDTPAYICSVHTKENVLKGAKKYLMDNPNFTPFRKFFFFNTAEQLAKDFSEGWHMADNTPVDPFEKAQRTTGDRLFA